MHTTFTNTTDSLDIPEFTIALAFKKLKSKAEDNKDDEPGSLSAAHLESLCVASRRYLMDKLQTKYPTLSCIHLTFGSLDDERHPPRFHVHWQGKATVEFITNDKEKDLPPPQEVFEYMIAALGTKEYLVQVVRCQPAYTVFSKAVEVQTRRWKLPTAGGTVQAPAFYMAFVSKQPNPLQSLTMEECWAFRQLAQQHVHSQLEKAYPDTLESVQLDMVKMELGAGQPEAKFNIYVECNVVAIFTQDTPDPMDLFQALTPCVNADFLDALDTLGASSTFWACIAQMVLRLCVTTEIPPIILAPPAIGEGDVEPILVKIHIDFYVALVLRRLERLPTQAQLAAFHEVVREHFDTILSSCYPGRFVNLTLDSESRFQAGIPLRRFNLLHQYHATLQFHVGTAPGETDLVSKFLQCNVPALIERIMGLSAPWNGLKEVTLGKAAEKALTDETYGGKIEEEEIPSPKSPQKKKVRNKPPKEKSIAPVLPPVPTMVEVEQPKEETIAVCTSSVFMAFTLSNEYDEPSEEAYERLAATTSEFYAVHLAKTYPKAFQGIQVKVHKTAFRLGIPDVRYHVYVEWDISATFRVVPCFHALQTAAQKTKIIPSDYFLCRSLIASLSVDYLGDHVCKLKGTPFAKTRGIYTEQVVTYGK
eukprot:scaffold492_cov99-Amphora_coffeaeformis.AAC.5